ncbi:hypothetical protein FS827_08355 [Agrobacterium vitis]|nr:hypothetical protein [Allorhizobium ampelinum]MCF1498602.1 hypothetical protein [Allorhizobium sp. Av2]
MAKTGRPQVDTEAVTVRLPRQMIEAIDTFRKTEADLPTRPEGIRRLLEGVLLQKGLLLK